MKAVRITILLTAAILTAACHSKSPVIITGDDEFLKTYTDPHYGGLRKLRGYMHFHFETSAINLCQDNQGECRLFYRPSPDENVGEPLDCWLEFSSDLDISKEYKDGSSGRFIVARGRVSGSNGIYGHMGGYSCQVKIEHVDAVYEHAPPAWGKEAEFIGPPPSPEP